MSIEKEREKLNKEYRQEIRGIPGRMVSVRLHDRLGNEAGVHKGIVTIVRGSIFVGERRIYCNELIGFLRVAN